jgi:hypothetical protein
MAIELRRAYQTPFAGEGNAEVDRNRLSRLAEADRCGPPFTELLTAWGETRSGA